MADDLERAATPNVYEGKLEEPTPQTEYEATTDYYLGDGEATTEFAPAIEYDEDVPVYWDMAAECYYYYGYVLYYDEEQENYYYWSFEENDYAYIDEETLGLINANQIYSYNNETGEYEMEDVAEGGDEAEGAGEEYGGEEYGEEDGAEDGEEALEQVEEAEEEADANEASEAEKAPEMQMPGEGLYGMHAGAPAEEELSPSMAALMEHVQAMNAPSDKFPNSIDSFNTSYHQLAIKGHQYIFDICSEDTSVLDQYRTRPNGSFVIGRCKRTVDGLMKGSLELKSLAPSEVSSVAGVLQSLNLPQLVYIRHQAQNSPWLKSPQATMKAFAIKCDECIAEKFIQYAFAQKNFGAPQAEIDRDQKLLKSMNPADVKYCGSWAVYCIGARDELNLSKAKILGEKATWWWLTANASPVIKGECDDANLKGIFFRMQMMPNQKLNLKAQFDRPADCNVVYRLVAGRGESYVRWDITEIVI